MTSPLTNLIPRFTGRRHHRAAGAFTLLEMLAAMAITVMIVLLLTGAFNQASRAWLLSENQTDTALRARIALGYMATDLAGALISPTFNFYGDSNHVAFIKAETESRYYTPHADVFEKMFFLTGSSRPYSIEYRTTQPDYLGPISVKEWNVQDRPGQLRTHDAWASSAREGGPLLDNVVYLRFTYYTNSPAAGVPFTVNYWNSFTNSVDSCWYKNSATLLAPQSYMTNRLPWGVLVELSLIDERAARRLAGASTTVADTIIRQAQKDYSLFIQIPTSRQ